MSTHTHTAGAVTQHLFITHNHRGTSVQLQLKKNSCARTLPLIGIQKPLRQVVTVIGSITILTGHFREIDIGVRRYLSGAAKTNMKFVLNH